jgi:hypothetical protein
MKRHLALALGATAVLVCAPASAQADPIGDAQQWANNELAYQEQFIATQTGAVGPLAQRLVSTATQVVGARQTVYYACTLEGRSTAWTPRPSFPAVADFSLSAPISCARYDARAGANPAASPVTETGTATLTGAATPYDPVWAPAPFAGPLAYFGYSTGQIDLSGDPQGPIAVRWGAYPVQYANGHYQVWLTNSADTVQIGQGAAEIVDRQGDLSFQATDTDSITIKAAIDFGRPQ